MEEKAMAREMTAKLAREVGKYEKELGDLNVFITKKVCNPFFSRFHVTT